MFAAGQMDDIAQSRERWLEKHAYAVLLGVLILLIIGISILLVWPGKKSWIDLLHDAGYASFHGLVTVVLIGYLYEKITRKSFLHHMKETVLDAMLIKSADIETLALERRKDAIRNCIASLVAKEIAAPLYATVIEPHINNRYNFRRNYRYIIFIDPYTQDLVLPDTSLCFNSNEYICVTEDIRFSRYGDNDNVVNVGFAYEPETLEELMGRGDFFFREVLRFDKRERDCIAQLRPEDLGRFVLEKMQLTGVVFDGRNEYPLPDPDISHAEDKDHVKYGVKITFDTSKLASHTAYDANCTGMIRIRFRMPQSRKYSQFLVSLPEPTEDPGIEFNWDVNYFTNVYCYPFLPAEGRGERNIEKGDRGIRVKLTKWVFPRSGVMFFWDYK